MISTAAIVAVTVVTFGIGAYGLRVARTTTDFFVASRAVPPLANASAISGEYLSAASFLGVAGLIMKFGAGMLWYPVGYAGGYLVLLLLVAAPLRRFGAYTIPDFAEGRFNSPALRRTAVGFVLLIGWFYLLPQLKGAGVTLGVVLGTPYWVGVVVVGVVVTANIALGGMKGITFVQAFQYWLKLVAIMLPVLFVVFAVRADHATADLTRLSAPIFRADTTVHIDSPVAVRVLSATPVTVHGTIDGVAQDGSATLSPGKHEIGRTTSLRFRFGALVPHLAGLGVVNGITWSRPIGGGPDDGGHPLIFTYSLIVATFLGTMGLPHILVRFYTNPDGRSARRTTLIVLVLLGAFYAFPAFYGALGRLFTPELYLTGNTDAVVLRLPAAVLSGLGGQLLGALVAAGAFAAFLSTSSGLLLSVAGALSHDVLRGSVRDFRRAAVVAGAVGVGLGLEVAHFDINTLVGWAFAIAASSFCPLLVLGIWWRRLTPAGAGAGLAVGGGLASASILVTIAGLAPGGWASVLLAEPAIWSVPTAFATMIVVSVLTPSSIPANVGAKMVALHAPEALGLSGSYRP